LDRYFIIIFLIQIEIYGSAEDEMILHRLEFICGEEKVKFESGVLRALIKTSDGDLRRAITTLQSCFRLKGKDHLLKVSDIQDISGVC